MEKMVYFCPASQVYGTTIWWKHRSGGSLRSKTAWTHLPGMLRDAHVQRLGWDGCAKPDSLPAAGWLTRSLAAFSETP